MNSDKETLKTKIVDALQTVYDPEIPVSVYELGLIYDIDITKDNDININKEFFSIFRKNLNFSMEKIEVKKLLSRYVDDANDSGIDLSLYNTFQSAVDLDLIMQNLNINKYNLYGSSYGTRLGRIIQELFPERLNAVILNSPNP